VIVQQLPPHVVSACAVMDAQRRQLFAARYSRSHEGRWQVVQSCRLIERGELAAFVPPGDVLTGPALLRLPEPLVDHETRSDPGSWVPRADTVGILAHRDYQAGIRTDIWQLQPAYYRPSYAEEK
jgi:tRNA threonylcarbamoyladenosine biosynthesis protein TsaB